MKIIKFSETLYRVYNNGKVKDCWIKDGEIQIHENKHHALTPTEMLAIEIEIF